MQGYIHLLLSTVGRWCEQWAEGGASERRARDLPPFETLYDVAMERMLHGSDSEEVKEGFRMLGGIPMVFLATSDRRGGIVAVMKTTRRLRGIQCKDIPCKLLALCFFRSCKCGRCCHKHPCQCEKSRRISTATMLFRKGWVEESAPD